MVPATSEPEGRRSRHIDGRGTTPHVLATGTGCKCLPRSRWTYQKCNSEDFRWPKGPSNSKAVRASTI